MNQFRVGRFRAPNLQPVASPWNYLLFENERRELVFKAVYLSMQLLDLALTLFAASMGYTELNPFMLSVLSSPLQLVLVKLVIPAVIIWLLPGKLILPGMALLAAVIGWNIKELLSLALAL